MAIAQSPIRTRSAAYLFILSFVTFGLYLPVWFTRSWAEMRRTGQVKMIHPLFHLLGLFVPIVSIYRVWRHARAANALGLAAAQPARFPAWIAVLTAVIAGACSGMALSVPSASGLGLALVGLILAACLIVRLQSLMNRYAENNTPIEVSSLDLQGPSNRVLLTAISRDGARREIDITALFAA